MSTHHTPIIEDLSFEAYRILLLANGSIRNLKINDVSSGGTLTDPRKTFSLALQENAKGIILSRSLDLVPLLNHDHPIKFICKVFRS
jgi:hypothetical protein